VSEWVMFHQSERALWSKGVSPFWYSMGSGAAIGVLNWMGRRGSRQLPALLHHLSVCLERMRVRPTCLLNRPTSLDCSSYTTQQLMFAEQNSKYYNTHSYCIFSKQTAMTHCGRRWLEQ
jgi:hypothetical protein